MTNSLFSGLNCGLARHAKIRYLIDGTNRRIGKLRNNVLEKSWLWQTQLHPAAQLDAAGNAQQFYWYGEKLNVPSYLVNRENGVNVTYRVISDHLGSVRLVVNADTGAVAQRLRYDEFGVVLEDTNPGFQPFGYAGGFYDTDTGLVRFGARDYDSGVGRWLAKDPIGFGGALNFYEYANNDPINNIDPDGYAPDRNLDGYFDPAFRSDQRYRGNPNIYEIAAHGNPKTIFNGVTQQHMNEQDFSDYINLDPFYAPGTPIKLLACSTGRTPDQGGDTLAQQLADRLGVVVIAPTIDTQVSVFGNYGFSNADKKNGGYFRTFFPRPDFSGSGFE